jgi:hypothetical protein
MNMFTRPYGYAVTSQRSNITKKGAKKTVRLICDRGRKLKDDPAPKKRLDITTTSACKCLLSIAVHLGLPTGL